MAVSEQKVRVAECDACGGKRYGEGSEKIQGVHGSVTLVDGSGNELTADYFSCRQDAGHVGKATVAAIGRAVPVPSGNGHTSGYGTGSYS